jgi:predicted transcriptional regulator|tara:strand:- start:12449 stop:12607 length:159 start_codon:yes stop_codon:yes gene_type:complete
MNDQENIKKIGERNKLEDSKKEEEEEKAEVKWKKEHLERLAILHRRARGEKW